MSNYLPRLSKTFWAYLWGLDEEVDRLLRLLDEERLSLLGKEFNKILLFAREKEELFKRIANGEERLSNIIRQILNKVESDEELKEMDTMRAFKHILTFKDFLRFEAWYTRYKMKRQEIRDKNLRNLKWAQEGLRESLEISKILMGRVSGSSGNKAIIYDQRGTIKEGV